MTTSNKTICFQIVSEICKAKTRDEADSAMRKARDVALTPEQVCAIKDLHSIKLEDLAKNEERKACQA